ncbi:MAG: 16S rRNA (guanine(527)-N(7))-methyltransferase RsmG [Lachnospiraceae bacterium]|nr:16S rRNA (guanine(527)-N(7))-methyltransferase RsmG [Lachnospiraceae bacterium]
MIDLSLLQKYMEEHGVSLSPDQFQKFSSFYDLLIEKNKVMNLTAITEPEEVVTKHFIDSLSVISVFEDISSAEYRLIDVGTGGGFPGIPLKIAFPNLHITLFDSLQKRILFLQDVILELGLSDIDAIHGRAEDFGRDESYREKYDLCVSRAVANLSTLSEYCLPFVKSGGTFISYKTDSVDEELSAASGAITILGGGNPRIQKYELYSTDAMRSLLIIDKVKSTPKKYPRKAPLPKKSPL